MNDLPMPLTKHMSELGATLSALATTPEALDCLEVFAELVSLESDSTRPHMLSMLLEPGGKIQMLTIGHAGPGLTVQVDKNLELSIRPRSFGED